MPNVTFTISAPNIDTLAKSFNYQPTVLDANGQPVANPESAGVFDKRMVVGLLTERIKNQLQQDAIAAANITDPVIT